MHLIRIRTAGRDYHLIARAHADRKARAPHILVYGQCGFGNFGNDATMELVLRHLRRADPGARLTAMVREVGPAALAFNVPTASMYPPPRFPPGTNPGPLSIFRRIANEVCRIAAAWRLVAGGDYMVFAGGGRFDDFNSTPSRQPYWKWKWISLGRLMGLPVEYVAVGAGPVDLKWSKRLYRWAGQMATRRSFRDEESKLYARKVLGIDTWKDQVSTDLVFAFPRPSAPPPHATPRTIGFGVMEYNNRRGTKGGEDDQYPAYIERAATLAKRLLSQGYDLRILIGETCDMSAAIDLYTRLAADTPDGIARVTLNPCANLHDALREMAQCDAVIATRFHNVVGALSLGRPVFSLGYASKNERLMEDFGLGAYCAHIESFDPESVLARFSELLSRSAFHAARIKARAAVHERMAQSELDGLSTRIRAATATKTKARTSRAAVPSGRAARMH